MGDMSCPKCEAPEHDQTGILGSIHAFHCGSMIYREDLGNGAALETLQDTKRCAKEAEAARLVRYFLPRFPCELPAECREPGGWTCGNCQVMEGARARGE